MIVLFTTHLNCANWHWRWHRSKLLSCPKLVNVAFIFWFYEIIKHRIGFVEFIWGSLWKSFTFISEFQRVFGGILYMYLGEKADNPVDGNRKSFAYLRSMTFTSDHLWYLSEEFFQAWLYRHFLWFFYMYNCLGAMEDNPWEIKFL